MFQESKLISIKNYSNLTEETILMVVGASKYLECIKMLAKTVLATNSPNICVNCWCFVTCSQLKAHRIDNLKNKKTPSQYGTEANFLGIAKDYNHFRLIDGVEEVKIFFAKPCQ